jgi:hypothetical protein
LDSEEGGGGGATSTSSQDEFKSWLYLGQVSGHLHLKYRVYLALKMGMTQLIKNTTPAMPRALSNT